MHQSTYLYPIWFPMLYVFYVYCKSLVLLELWTYTLIFCALALIGKMGFLCVSWLHWFDKGHDFAFTNSPDSQHLFSCRLTHPWFKNIVHWLAMDINPKLPAAVTHVYLEYSLMFSQRAIYKGISYRKYYKSFKAQQFWILHIYTETLGLSI